MENVRVAELIVNQMYVYEILRSVSDSPGMSKTDIVRMISGPEGDRKGERTIRLRIQNLIDSGLLDFKQCGPRNASKISITSKGERILEHIEAIKRILSE